MRIGLFTDSYPPLVNGVSTSVYVLKKALEAQGHKVFVVTVNNINHKYVYEENRTIMRIPGINIHMYDYRLTGIYPIRSISTIRRWRLDIIHSHTEFGIGTFARIIAKQYNIPLVHTYHTMYEDYAHYITRGHFKKLSQKIIKAITLFYCDKVLSELIVPTQKTYNLFKNKYKVKRDIHIIPTGLELETLYPENQDQEAINKIKERYNIAKNDFIILFVGRVASEKSIDVLIEGHVDIVKKNPQAKLIIVGAGPADDEIKALIKEKNLEDNIIMTGKVPLEEVPLYYNLSNLFATASKTETQGVTLIEAMAAEVPVVCVSDDSFKIIVKNSKNGYFFLNKWHYAKIVNRIINKPERLEKLGTVARASTEEFSSTNYALNVLKVYDLAISNYTKKRRYFFRKKNVKVVDEECL